MEHKNENLPTAAWRLRLSALGLVMALLLSSAATLAIADSPAIAGRASGPVWINGTAWDFATGVLVPIENAVVVATNVSDSSTLPPVSSDAAGHFNIDVVDDGTYNLTVTHVDYQTNVSWDFPADSNSTTGIDIGLVRLPSTLWGTVTDGTTNTSLVGATIGVDERNTTTAMEDLRSAVSGVNGSYAIGGLVGGVGGSLWVSAPGYLSDVLSSGGDLGPNATRQVNVTLQRQEGMVSGTVVDLDGAPIEGVTITLATTFGSWWTTTDVSGNYGLQVPFGDYVMSANAPGFFGASDNLYVAPLASLDIDLTLEATPPLTATVDGRVRDAGTLSGIVGAQVTFWDQDRPGKQLGTATVAGGAYDLAIYAGFFRVSATAPGYRAEVSFATISDGQTLPLEHLLSALTLDRTIGGNVTASGAPLAGALLALSQAGVQLSTTTTDASGDFSLPALSGDLTIDISASGHFSTSIDITVGAMDITGRSYDLLPIPAATLLVDGYVRTPDGLSVVGATVTLTDLALIHGGYTISTSANTGGFFTLWTYSGSFILTVDAPAWQGQVVHLQPTSAIHLGDLVLDPSPATAQQTTATWHDFANLTLRYEDIVEADAALTRWTIDRDFGDADQEVDAAEVAAYEAWLMGRGPSVTHTAGLLELDSQGFDVVGSSLGVDVSGATGNDTDEGAITTSWWATFLLDGTADGDTHEVTYRIDYDTAALQRSALLELPVGLQVRDLLSAAAPVSALDTAPSVTIDGTVPANTSGTSEIVSFTAFPNEGPMANAGADKVVQPDTAIAFDGRTSTDDQGVVNYTWDIGGIETLYGAQVHHNFTLANGSASTKVVVTLTVRDNGGLMNDTMLNVTVDGQGPVASFGITDAAGAAATSVDEDAANLTFTSTSTDNIGVSNVSWDFGDNRIEFGTTVNHSWNQPGEYSVEVTVLDEAGHSSNATHNITVRDTTAPDAKLNSNTPTQKTVGENVTFNCSASSDNSPAEDLSCSWHFGDNSTEMSGKEVVHVYTQVGVHEAMLMVTDAAGNSDTAYWNITILEKRKEIDLTPLSLKVSPKDPKQNQQVTIKVVIKNQGKDPAPAFKVEFKDGAKTIGEKTVNTLAANTTVEVTIKWTPTRDGDHTVKASVNPENEFAETNRGNQTISDVVTVAIDNTQQILIAAAIIALIVGAALVVWYNSTTARRRRKRRL